MSVEVISIVLSMVMAGLETSLDDFKENGDKAVTFGLATFIVPMVLGTAAMMALGHNAGNIDELLSIKDNL
ncbi:MAG: cation:proton antiporter [Cyanobacteria bacterium P01_G01_bin.49]